MLFLTTTNVSIKNVTYDAQLSPCY